MSDFRDFDAARKERDRLTNVKPLRFRLGGEEFQLIARPTLIDVLELAAAPDPKDAEKATTDQEYSQIIIESAKAIAVFVERMLPNERARKRWRKVIASKADVIDSLTFIELGYWLAEEYSGRPWAPSNDSAAGRRTTGETTRDERFAPDSGSQT